MAENEQTEIKTRTDENPDSVAAVGFENRANLPFVIVGIGASAGGLAALEEFFDQVSPDSGMAFVVVQHLSPDHTSMLSDILGRRARIPVPPDTISADPRLAPLAEYGGPTRTHLLLSDSPAINRGSNLLNRAYDQRGPEFPRVKGAFPDIGAIER